MLFSQNSLYSQTAAKSETNPFFLAAFEGAEATFEALLSTDLKSSFPLSSMSADGFSLLSAALPMCRGERGARVLSALLNAGLNPNAIEPVAPAAEAYRHRALSAAFDEAQDQGLNAPTLPIGLVAIAADWRASKMVWDAISPEAKLAMSARHGAVAAAAKASNIEALRDLAALGASMNQLDARGQLPLSSAPDADTLRALLELGADLNALNAKGQSALQIMMGWQSRGASEKEMAKIAVDWVSSRPAPSAPGQGGGSLEALAKGAFSALAGKNKNAARQAVLALGPNSASQTDELGRGLMWAAVNARNFPEARRLLKFGCDPFALAPDGSSAFQELAFTRSDWSRGNGFEPIAHQIASELAGKTRSPVPWAERSDRGFCLAETFFPTASCLGPFWAAVARPALEAGWSPNEERAGRATFLQEALLYCCSSHKDNLSTHAPAVLQLIKERGINSGSPQSALAFLNSAQSDMTTLKTLAGSTTSLRHHGLSDPIAAELCNALSSHALLCAQKIDLSQWSPSEEAWALCPEFCATVEAMAIKQATLSAKSSLGSAHIKLRI